MTGGSIPLFVRLIEGTDMNKVLMAVAVSCAASLPLIAQQNVRVELKDAQGQSVGTAVLSPSGSGVSIALDLKNLTPGRARDPISTRWQSASRRSRRPAGISIRG